MPSTPCGLSKARWMWLNMSDILLRIPLLIFLLPLHLGAASLPPTASGDTLFVDVLSQLETFQRVGSNHTYALSKDIVLPERMTHLTLEAILTTTIQFEKGSNAMLVFTIMAADTLRFWDALALRPSGSDGIASAEKRLLLPPDYLQEGIMRIYFWNPDSATFTVNKASIRLQRHTFPNLLPSCSSFVVSGPLKLLYQTPRFELHYYPETGHLLLADSRGKPLTGPWQWCLETNKADQGFERITDHWKLAERSFTDDRMAAVLLASNGFERIKMTLTTDVNHGLNILVESRARKKFRAVRQALVIPLVEKPEHLFDDKAIAYRPESLESVYLGNGGCLIGKEERRLVVLQSRQITALQLDIPFQRLIANLTYAPGHPLIHYPEDEHRGDFFVDLSAPKMVFGSKATGRFSLWPLAGSATTPRLMPIPTGAEAAVVWTEHADWTNIRTQRAVHFGCDTIHRAEEAIGGFDKYGIRITKSVFFHNPEKITNRLASKGLFKGYKATLTDNDFSQFIDGLHQAGHEICLHTPEQHSSTRAWMKQALAQMAVRYKSTTWIDHGYNNHPVANRENLTCDGLKRKSKHYAADLWRKYGIQNLWNPALEELRPFEQYGFDGNFIIPYPGFGPVLPAPVFTTHPHAQHFLLWNTTGTLEMPADDLWAYGFSSARLERLMKYHSIWVNHVYPAWTLQGKGFWYFDADSNLVAMDGFNRALQRMAALGNTGRLLNTTLADLAGYHSALRHVELIPLADNVLKVINHNATPIYQLSFATSSDHVEVIGHKYQQRRHLKTTYFWFDLRAGESVEVRY